MKWVQRQRHAYRKRMTNEETGATITDERYKLMVDANFPFDTRAKPSTEKFDTEWRENLELLKPCIRDDGKLDYSSLDDEVRRRIVTWVQNQRAQVRCRERNEHSTITDERYKLLSEANFPFDTRATPITTPRAKPVNNTKKKKVKECACCEIELNEGNCSAAQLKKGSGKGKCKSCTSKRGPAPGTSWKVGSLSY